MAKNKKVDPIPRHFKSLAEAGEFWDTHDLTDYWDQTHEVKGRVDTTRQVFLTALEPSLFKKLSECSKRKGVSTETLINVWLTEKVTETLQTK
jgi:hypothetical protein